MSNIFGSSSSGLSNSQKETLNAVAVDTSGNLSFTANSTSILSNELKIKDPVIVVNDNDQLENAGIAIKQGDGLFASLLHVGGEMYLSKDQGVASDTSQSATLNVNDIKTTDYPGGLNDAIANTGGEVNVASSDGGLSLVNPKVGEVLHFKGLVAGDTQINITPTANELILSLTEGQINHDELQNTGAKTHAQIDAALTALETHTHVATDITDFTTASEQVISDNKNISNGICGLDIDGKIPENLIPFKPLRYCGSWDANTNTPDLVGTTPDAGCYYIVTVAGTTSLNGINDWKVNEWAVYSDEAGWHRVEHTGDYVQSVSGKTGIVSLVPADITGLAQIDDNSVLNTDLWSASKIDGELKAITDTTLQSLDLTNTLDLGYVMKAIYSRGDTTLLGTATSSGLNDSGGTIYMYNADMTKLLNTYNYTHGVLYGMKVQGNRLLLLMDERATGILKSLEIIEIGRDSLTFITSYRTAQKDVCGAEMVGDYLYVKKQGALEVLLLKDGALELKNTLTHTTGNNADLFSHVQSSGSLLVARRFGDTFDFYDITDQANPVVIQEAIGIGMAAGGTWMLSGRYIYSTVWAGPDTTVARHNIDDPTTFVGGDTESYLQNGLCVGWSAFVVSKYLVVAGRNNENIYVYDRDDISSGAVAQSTNAMSGVFRGITINGGNILLVADDGKVRTYQLTPSQEYPALTVASIGADVVSVSNTVSCATVDAENVNALKVNTASLNVWGQTNIAKANIIELTCDELNNFSGNEITMVGDVDISGELKVDNLDAYGVGNDISINADCKVDGQLRLRDALIRGYGNATNTENIGFFGRYGAKYSGFVKSPGEEWHLIDTNAQPTLATVDLSRYSLGSLVANDVSIGKQGVPAWNFGFSKPVGQNFAGDTTIFQSPRDSNIQAGGYVFFNNHADIYRVESVAANSFVISPPLVVGTGASGQQGEWLAPISHNLTVYNGLGVQAVSMADSGEITVNAVVQDTSKDAYGMLGFVFSGLPASYTMNGIFDGLANIITPLNATTTDRRITVDVDGVYEIGYNVNAAAEDNALFIISLRKNGANVANTNTYIEEAKDIYGSYSNVVYAELVSGDYIELHVNTNTKSISMRNVKFFVKKLKEST